MLEGEITREGLWLTSTTEEFHGERFRVVATSVGRQEDFVVLRQSEAPTPLLPGEELAAKRKIGVAMRFPPHSTRLSTTGTMEVGDNVARFIRPGLAEEYSVSVDGVRQDFVVLEKPVLPLYSKPSTLDFPAGALRVELQVTGAKSEALVDGERLVQEESHSTG